MEPESLGGGGSLYVELLVVLYIQSLSSCGVESRGSETFWGVMGPTLRPPPLRRSGWYLLQNLGAEPNEGFGQWGSFHSRRTRF